jgi:D-3-phosphoglycerate dehydrogenase
MKKGVRIFNCARGGLIDESALVDAIKDGTVAAAGLDVFETEPLPKDHVLRTLPQVTLTPHLGASTAEAQESVGVEIAEAVAEVLAGGAIRNAVNLPSLDAASVRALTPYLELGKKLGTLVQQLGPSQVEKLSLTYWGRMVDLDSDSITRGITRGFLQRISGDAVNFVNAPVLMKRLGIEVEVTKSSGETEYTELIEVEATSGGTVVASAAGTFVGKGHLPRVVTINGRPVEASLDGTMLILENHDEPGIVGFVGTVLGRHKINIASMSLGRNEAGGTAFTVLNLDTVPSDEAMAEIEDSDSIKSAVIVDL